MKVTTDHPAVANGYPVILDDAGRVMDYKPGVKAVRTALRLDQREFAARLGVSVSAVRTWEQGVNVPRADRLNAMAELLPKHRTRKAKP